MAPYRKRKNKSKKAKASGGPGPSSAAARKAAAVKGPVAGGSSAAPVEVPAAANEGPAAANEGPAAAEENHVAADEEQAAAVQPPPQPNNEEEVRPGGLNADRPNPVYNNEHFDNFFSGFLGKAIWHVLGEGATVDWKLVSNMLQRHSARRDELDMPNALWNTLLLENSIQAMYDLSMSSPNKRYIYYKYVN